MKKNIAMLLTLVFILTCGFAFADAYHIGIIQMADNGAFTDMREGFIDRMRELGYDEEKMIFTYRNALGDMTQLVANCEAALDDGIDAAVTIATTAGSIPRSFIWAAAMPVLLASKNPANTRLPQIK